MDVPCVITYHEDMASSLSAGLLGRRQAVAACTRCGQCVAGGDSERAVARSLVMLRNTCPRNERNFYVREQPAAADDPE